jgi:uncharacterized HAD superfamily protein
VERGWLVIRQLRYGIDIDGTITQAPRHFKNLIDALIEDGDYIIIITARDESMREETEETLKTLNINYHDILMMPLDWGGTIPEFKVKAVRESGVQLMFDNEEENCWAVQQQTTCLTAHILPIPEIDYESAGDSGNAAKE